MNSSNLRGFFQRFGLLISFMLLCVVLSLLSDRFLTPGNWVNILRQSSINLIIAIGMTYVILTAGIDLSVGAVLALSTVVTVDLLQRGIPILPTMILGLTLGGVLGLASGLLISRVKVPPFVATLGMMTVARGLALTYTQGRPITGLPELFQKHRHRLFGTGTHADHRGRCGFHCRLHSSDPHPDGHEHLCTGQQPGRGTLCRNRHQQLHDLCLCPGRGTGCAGRHDPGRQARF